MDKKEWAAIATAVATVLTALLASLAGLGEHAPSTVLALIVIGIVLFFYIAREKQIEQEHVACRECKREHIAAYREMWQSLMETTDAMNEGLAAINVNIATLSRGNQISAKLDALVQRMDKQEAGTVADNLSASAANVAAIDRDAAMGGRIDALSTRMNGKDDGANVRKRTKTTGGKTG